MPAASPPCSGPSSMPLSRQTALAKWTFEPSSGKRNSVTTYTMAAIMAMKVMLKTENSRFFTVKTSFEAFDFSWKAVYTNFELIKRASKGENYKTR